MPAPSAIPNSTTCQPIPPQASSLARALELGAPLRILHRYPWGELQFDGRLGHGRSVALVVADRPSFRSGVRGRCTTMRPCGDANSLPSCPRPPPSAAAPVERSLPPGRPVLPPHSHGHRPRAMIELDGHRQGADRRGRRRAPRACSAAACARRASRSTASATGARAARPRRAASLPDVLVIDIGLPDADGRDVCQALRARGIEAPVLFLTARDALADRVAGFDAGGDDYVTKPFALAELVARLHALLRRARRRPARIEAAGCGSTRSRTRSSADGVEVAADADRVPAARAAARAARARRFAGASSSAPAGRTARIVRDNTLDAYVARLRRKLEQHRRRAGDRDRARRRLPRRMSCRGRAAAASSSLRAVAARARGARDRLQPPPRAHARPRRARLVLRSRAAAQLELVDASHGRVRLARGARTTRSRDSRRLGASQGSRVIERAARAARRSTRRRVARAAGRARLPRRRRQPTCGCTRVPVVARRHARSARSSPALSLAPYEQTRTHGARRLARLRRSSCSLLVGVAARWLLAVGAAAGRRA